MPSNRMIFIKTGGKDGIKYHLPKKKAILGVGVCGAVGTPIAKSTKPKKVCEACCAA